MYKEVPLYRALSKLGYTSRTKAMTMISAGEISVDGKQCLDPYQMVSLDTTRIQHHVHQLKKEVLKVVLLYKPKGVITSSKDEQNRPTIYTLLPPDLHRLHSVGRLDFATSGLLLLTNSTLLSSWLTEPCNGVPRVYVVTVRGLFTPEKVQAMQAGIIDNGQELKTDAVIVRKSSNRESHLVITLTEGKNREVRRLCSSMGNEVTRLKRVSYGPLSLGTMSPGDYRNINKEELYAAFPGMKKLLL
jgi:23S rRNA pseudouridine2605 synthase